MVVNERIKEIPNSVDHVRLSVPVSLKPPFGSHSLSPNFPTSPSPPVVSSTPLPRIFFPLDPST